MINYNKQSFKNGDVDFKTHFKSYLEIMICFVVLSILLIVQHTFMLNEINNIGVVFLFKQLLFILIGLIMAIFIYVSFRLSIKEIVVLFLFLTILIIIALLMIYKTNILSIDVYLFVTHNLHYYLLILGELSYTLIFKVLKIKWNSNIS